MAPDVLHGRQIQKRSTVSTPMQETTVMMTPVTTARSCARCGQGFQATGRQFVCPDCRKPEARRSESADKYLSFRERQIVALVQEGKPNKEIASDLCLTEGTVKEYLHHIFRKLNVRNRTQLALWGRSAPTTRAAEGMGDSSVRSMYAPFLARAEEA